MAGKGKRDLPEGWRISGLYVEGAGKAFKVDKGDTVTDNDIARADAIIVEYTSRSTGTTVSRTIHGAGSKSDVGSIITNVVRKVSPTRKGRTKGSTR